MKLKNYMTKKELLEKLEDIPDDAVIFVRASLSIPKRADHVTDSTFYEEGDEKTFVMIEG